MTGVRQWQAPLPGELRAPMLLRGNLLLGLTTPDVLIAFGPTRVTSRGAARWATPAPCGWMRIERRRLHHDGARTRHARQPC